MIMKYKYYILEKYNNLSPSVRASFWFLFSNIFQKSIMVIFTPLFTRIMTVEEYSKYALFQSWVTIFTVFATLNISNYATAKALVEFKEDRDKFISSAEFLTAILTIFIFGIYLLIRFVFGWLDEFPLWIIILLFADILGVAFFAFWSQMERFNLKYRALAIVSILMGIFSPVIAFICIALSDSFELYKGWARIIGLAVTDIFVGVFIFYLSYKKSKVLLYTKYWKFCFSYCIPLIPHFLAMAFLQKIGQLFVERYCGSDMSGIYALANTLAMLMMVVNDAFTKTLVPWTYQKLSEKKYEEVNKPVILALVLIAVINVAMALVTPEIVCIFADKAYAQAIYAVPPLVAVCYFGFLYNTFANIEYYFKETKLVSYASITAGFVILLFNFILVPKFGFLAAAYSSLLSYIVYALMHYCFMRKTLKKHLNGIQVYDNRLIFKMSMVFTAIILCIPLLYRFSIIRYLTIAVVLGVIVLFRKRVFNLICVMFSGSPAMKSQI